MKTITVSIISILVTSLFMACNTPTYKQQTQTLEFYSDGTPMKTRSVVDSNRVLIKEYYQDGVLKSSTEMLNGKKNGVYVEFFENGDTSILTPYDNDRIDGIYKKYFKNGGLNVIASFKHNEINGESVILYDNGSLDYYSFYTSINPDTPRYAIWYDTLGQISSEMGYPLINSIKNDTSSEYSLGDTISVWFQTVKPDLPNIKLELNVKAVKDGNVIDVQRIDIIDHIGFNSFYVVRRPGDYLLMTELTRTVVSGADSIKGRSGYFQLDLDTIHVK